jgi:uncharacterized protein
VAPPLNPFRFGDLALDQAFANRRRELAELSADVRNGQNTVIFAPRRYGKTSLIWRAAQQLVTEGVLVAQVDLMRTPTKERLAERLSEAIHEQIASPLLRAADRLRVFAGLRVRPTITVDPTTGATSFSFSARLSREDIDRTLEELLTLPAELASRRRRRVALVFDEFQEIVDIDAQLINIMRSVFQEQPEVAHVFLGSRRHMMERIFNDENEPFWRSAKQMELGPIDPDVFGRFAQRRFEQSGKRLRPEAGADALRLTRGHPYATQELFYALWELTPPDGLAEPDLVPGALEQTLRSEHAHLSLLWERASATQRLVLQALAAEQPARPLSSQYQQRHSLPGAPSVQAALDSLIRAEVVVRRSRGEYRISEPFLAEWIRRIG